MPVPEAAAGLGLALAGAVAGLVQLMPQSGTSFAPGWRFGWDPIQARQALAMPWRAFVPLPQPGLHFWNTNLLDPWPGLPALAGLAMLALAAALLWRSKVALTGAIVATEDYWLFRLRHDRLAATGGEAGCAGRIQEP